MARVIWHVHWPMKHVPKGLKAMYFNMNKLTEQILLSKVDGTYLKLLARLENTHYLYWTTLAYRL